MPVKSKRYRLVKFAPAVFREAYTVFCNCLDEQDKSSYDDTWWIAYEDERWRFDSEEEFYSQYRKEIKRAELRRQHGTLGEPSPSNIFALEYSRSETEVYVELRSTKDIEKVFEVFEANYQKYRISEADSKEVIQEKVKVFIGHGCSQQWRALKDHLQDKHNFKVITYETYGRAGQMIPEVLEDMSEEASIAFLVHTGEDEDKAGRFHARGNVIHETGFFQARLGFERAIILLEEGCEEYSNIVGIQQLRFPKNNIKAIFGDVVATIYDQFGASA